MSSKNVSVHVSDENQQNQAVKTIDELLGAVAFTAVNKNGVWYVRFPDKTSVGPYHTGAIALQVAIINVLSARKQGLDAYVFVEDDDGGKHKCMLMYNIDRAGHCGECERSWSGSRFKLSCAMRFAIGDR